MTTGWRQFLLAGIALAACTIGSSARADVIDGNWCGPDGRVFTITGPRIVTPAGTATTGDYSRHSFAYVVPASDPGAGVRITMQLLNETTVRLTADRGPEIWHRCDVTS